MRDGGEMENGVILDRGVEPGVIAERAFRSGLARLDISFEHEIDIGRNIEIDCFASNQSRLIFAAEIRQKESHPARPGSGAVAAKV